jgi:hypothetical protein
VRALGVALGALAFAPLAGLLLRVATKGGYWTGADAFLVLDQMQYVNWTRQAAGHGLIANLYDLLPGPRSFLHPGVLVSGLLNLLGVPAAWAYIAWKPAAVLALWAGAKAWVERFVPEPRRLPALALALFFCSPLAALVGWTGWGGLDTRFDFDFLSGELTTNNYLWGYLFTAIAVGLMPLGLLAHERGSTGVAAAVGLVVAWFQPWQGATYLLVVGGAELLTRRDLRRLVLVGAATMAPLVYYLLLSRLDDAWKLAGKANDFEIWPWWVTVLGLAVLALPALTGLAQTHGDLGGWMLRLWPLAALVVLYQPFGTFPAHALQGVTLPLVTLAFLGVGATAGRVALAVALALLIVPGTAYRVDELRKAVNAGRQPFFLTGGEHDALRYLDRTAAHGGVLAPVYMGLLVPAWTERETWVGAGSWTPDFEARVQQAEQLFSARLSRAQAEALVRGSGARFLLSDCHGRADIRALVAGVTARERRFGCATVWEVRR